MKFILNMDEVTAGDIEAVEDALGWETAQRLLSGQMTSKVILAAIWLAGRQADPSYTLDAARLVKLTELDVENPTVAPPGLAAAPDESGAGSAS